MKEQQNGTPSERPAPKEGIGCCAFKHVAGMGIGTIIGAGIGTGYAAFKGHKLYNGAAAGGGIGLLSSFGFGHMLYDSVTEKKSHTFADIVKESQTNTSDKAR